MFKVVGKVVVIGEHEIVEALITEASCLFGFPENEISEWLATDNK